MIVFLYQRSSPLSVTLSHGWFLLLSEGDVGAVGLFNGEKRRVVLDLKGIQYAGPMVAAHTLCTVQVVEGQAVRGAPL
eukprot:SAG25_NODE_807_length_5249_cov_3.894369_5_plen_78_part_00